MKFPELDATLAKLRDIFAEAGPEHDLTKITSIPGTTADKLAEIKRLNGRVDELREVARAAKAATGDRGGKSASPLTAVAFSETDLADLFDAAKGRRMATKISSVEAPQSTATRYSFEAFPVLRDRARILDLLPVESTTGASVTYYTGTTGATAATAVAEGADKPESEPDWTSAIAEVRKIAHWAKVTDEVIADFPSFRNLVGQEMISGLIDQENEQLLNGNGTAPNLRGLLTTVGIQTQVAGSDPIYDALFKATNKIRTGSAYTEPTVIVLHPDDWATVALTRTADGLYIVGAPTQAATRQLWGIPVVVTTRIASGTGMVANLQAAARAHVRQPPTLEVNPMGGEAEWKANLTLIRAEERLALAVPRPTAIVKVTF